MPDAIRLEMHEKMWALRDPWLKEPGYLAVRGSAVLVRELAVLPVSNNVYIRRISRIQAGDRAASPMSVVNYVTEGGRIGQRHPNRHGEEYII